MSSGNGSLMRVAPIGLVFNADLELAGRMAQLSSKATHPYATCVEACAVYTILIVHALRSDTKADLVDVFAKSEFMDADLRARLSSYPTLDAWSFRDESDIKSSGYVIDTLEAALWAFFTTQSFKEGALKVVNLGE
jgi:ADP-ribosyl-[dinitrogen reductase] hydrolase